MALVSKVGKGGLNLDFQEVIKRFGGSTKGIMAEAHRRAAIRVFSDIINTTPVDTGEAAGGWVISTGNIPVGRMKGTGPGASLARLSAIKADYTKVTFMSNAVGHVAGLEYGTHWYGYSPKAPAGMVRINVRRFPQIVHEEIVRLKK